jgi:hypothetical protein
MCFVCDGNAGLGLPRARLCAGKSMREWKTGSLRSAKCRQKGVSVRLLSCMGI